MRRYSRTCSGEVVCHITESFGPHLTTCNMQHDLFQNAQIGYNMVYRLMLYLINFGVERGGILILTKVCSIYNFFYCVHFSELLTDTLSF